MTSFFPTDPQSFDTLKNSPPPTMMLEAVTHAGTEYERLWIGMRCGSGRPLCVTRDVGKGVELIRYSNNSPNAVLQALATYWGCSVVSEYDDETFEPVLQTP